MHYDHFIRTVENHQTDRIRAFVGVQQTSPECVPSVFALLIGDIVRMFADNVDNICGKDHAAVIFGLQRASAMVVSNQPLETERFVNALQPDYHFCCTLDFFKVPLERLDNFDDPDAWIATDSVVIDFTSGELMNSKRFLAKVHRVLVPAAGKLYGCIAQETLDVVWSILKIRQEKAEKKKFIFNHLLMEPPPIIQYAKVESNDKMTPFIAH